MYYDNGQIAEETKYRNGELDGRAIYYSIQGVVLKTLVYVANELYGDAKSYNSSGDILVEGQYKNGKKYGV